MMKCISAGARWSCAALACLSLGFAAQALGQQPSSQQPGETRAKEIVQGKCFLCHGMNGESASELFPRLAGQHAEYVAKQLRDFQAGRRAGQMTEFAKGLTEGEMLAIGRYFEKQEGQPHSVNDPDLAAIGRYLYQKGNIYSGVPACASCHGPKGYGTSTLPRLAGQHAEYTVRQLKDFNKRIRTNDNTIMHNIAALLTELETRGVAEYLSGLH